MANATNDIRVDAIVDPCTRVIKGTVGATGNLDFGRHFNNWDTISIQLAGTFDSVTVTVNISDDEDLGYVAPATAVAFTTAGRKTIALADLGFRYLRFVMASGAGSADVDFCVTCSRRNDRAKPT